MFSHYQLIGRHEAVHKANNFFFFVKFIRANKRPLGQNVLFYNKTCLSSLLTDL